MTMRLGKIHINPFLLFYKRIDPDLRNEIRCRFHSSSTRCFFCWVGWSALIRLDRVDHVGIFTMNDPPGEASHGTPLINKTGEIEYTGITPIPISVK